MNSLTSPGEQDRIAEAAASIHTEVNIGRLLLNAGKLQPQDMERVLKLQQEQNLRFGEAAQQLGLVSEADIQQALSLQFEYPNLSDDAGLSQELTAAISPHGKEAEALRSLRSELDLRWFTAGRKTLAIVGANVDEGSSYLTANLAVLYAQMGRKVLVLDANLRQPRQHEIFNLGRGMGLSDLLAERIPSLQFHSFQPFQGLHVLPAGSPPPNPAELLARPAFAALLSGLESNYDYILVDTAPSQLGSDFQLVAARVGGMLIATRRNVSRINRLEELKKKTTLTGAQIVGAVVLD